MYNMEDAQGEDNVSLLVYAGIALLAANDFSDFVTLSVTGGEKGNDNIVSFGLNASIRNDISKTEISDEEMEEAVLFLLTSLAYDFSVHQKWIVHITAEKDKEYTNPDVSGWKLPTI